MNLITLNDRRYPQLLKKIGREAPAKLYYQGDWEEEIFENCLAVVGARRITNYGKEVVEKLVGELVAPGLTIVSGFMYGVDAQAHRTALRAGGRTIAVMPCGIDLIHPSYQTDLYQEILNKKGLIISEYPGKFPPTKWTYPRRNRIVAGLARAVLIIEAGQQSGSLITANWARKFGRKVFAVPGPINSENSQGTLGLIKKGGELVISAKDILDFYPIKREFYFNQASQTREEKGIVGKILAELRREPLETDELARIFNLSVSQLGAILSLLELQGLIHQKGRKYYPN